MSIRASATHQGFPGSSPAVSGIDGFAKRFRDAFLLLGRLLIGGIFVLSGYGKLMGLSAFAASLEQKGVPCLPHAGDELVHNADPRADKFVFGAPAELFPSRGNKGRSRVLYKRFATAAEAVRFAIEDVPPAALALAELDGTVIVALDADQE